jgi:hypothetical protein
LNETILQEGQIVAELGQEVKEKGLVVVDHNHFTLKVSLLKQKMLKAIGKVSFYSFREAKGD